MPGGERIKSRVSNALAVNDLRRMEEYESGGGLLPCRHSVVARHQTIVEANFKRKRAVLQKFSQNSAENSENAGCAEWVPGVASRRAGTPWNGHVNLETTPTQSRGRATHFS